MSEITKVPESDAQFPGENESVVYCTDNKGLITAVNEGWQVFAARNRGEAVAGDRVLGFDVWGCVVDPSLRAIYELLFKRAQAGAQVSFTYRCDAPDRRRWLNMTISRLEANRIQFESKLLREESRPLVALLEPGHQRSECFIRVCSWCQLVATESDGWVPVEKAVILLGLMEEDELPQLSHGICPDCAQVMWTEIDRLKGDRG